MTLASTLVSDAKTIFTSTDDFAEADVTYHPRVGGSRVIDAVVEREQVESLTETGGQITTPVWHVHVANDSVAGIASDEVDTGGDEIAIPLRDGEAASRRSVTKIVSQDPGMLVLELR